MSQLPLNKLFTIFLPIFFLFQIQIQVRATPIFPAALSPSTRDTTSTQYNRTTTCLSSLVGGCCAIDSYGTYTNCYNATLSASNVPWTGMPTTQMANLWSCLNPVNNTIMSPACCTFTWIWTSSTSSNGVQIPVLEKVMTCTASNQGLSKKRDNTSIDISGMMGRLLARWLE